MLDKKSNDRLIKESLAALAKAKFQLDKIQKTRPYAIEFRIINEMMLRILDNLEPR